MPKAIPDRWLPYSCVGSVIPGTRLICFKVPLRTAVIEAQIASGVRIDEIWDIQTLLNRVPKLRLVIDLTNTNRYYDPGMLECAGVQHVKIAMPGRVIPPEGVVNAFCDTVEQFLGSSDDDDALVGVHCTHGLNRTGYMVCRYLRDRLSIPPKQAIETFEAARGYKIERDNYLADILGREAPPPDFGQITVLKPVEIAPNPDKGQRYGRQRKDRPSREGSSGCSGREWTGGRDRERSPIRNRRAQERNGEEKSCPGYRPYTHADYTREGSSGWSGREWTGGRDRERSPIRNRREQERNGEEERCSGYRTYARAEHTRDTHDTYTRVRAYSNGGDYNDREYDFRYDY